MSTAVRLSQRRSLRSPDTSSGATRSTGLASVPSTHTTWSLADPLDAAPRSSSSAPVDCTSRSGLRAGVLGRVERARCGRPPAPARTRPRATVDGAGQVVGQAAAEPPVAVGAERLGEEAAGVVDARGQLVVGDHARGCGGPGR